jgi:hypothetical protein
MKKFASLLHVGVSPRDNIIAQLKFYSIKENKNDSWTRAGMASCSPKRMVLKMVFLSPELS